MRHTRPRILITGTPGVGKSTVATELGQKLDLRVVNVGDAIREEQLYEEVDNERECTVFDDDAVYAYLEEQMHKTGDNGGLIVDFHSVEPMALKRWFDLILVLHTDTSVLWERLEARRYKKAKVEENVECEIMRVIEIDVLEFFEDEEPIPEMVPIENLPSTPVQQEIPVLVNADNDTPEQRELIVSTLIDWVKKNY